MSGRDDGARRALIALSGLLYGAFLIRYGLYYLTIEFVDLPSFHFAARTAFQAGESPYDAARLAEAGARYGQPVFPFLYPPPSLLGLYPLSLVSYRTAATVTLVLNHLLVPGFLLLFLSRIRAPVRRRPLLVALIVAYSLIYHPLEVTLNHGQVNLLVLVLLCLSWYALREERHPGLVALPLSLAALLKSYPAVFLAFLLAKGKRAAAGWTLGLLAIYAAVAWFVLPRTAWSDWTREVLPTGGYGTVPFGLFSPAGPWNQGINGFVARLFLPNEFSEALLPSPSAGRVVPYALSLLVMASAFLLSLSRRRTAATGDALDLEFSLWLVTMFLVAPLAWEHQLVFVLPAAFLALEVALSRDRFGWAEVLVVGASFLLAWRLPAWAEALKGGVAVLGISLKFYAASVLWGFLAWQVFRRGADAAKTGPSMAPGNL